VDGEGDTAASKGGCQYYEEEGGGGKVADPKAYHLSIHKKYREHHP